MSRRTQDMKGIWRNVLLATVMAGLGTSLFFVERMKAKDELLATRIHPLVEDLFLSQCVGSGLPARVCLCVSEKAGKKVDTNLFLEMTTNLYLYNIYMDGEEELWKGWVLTCGDSYAKYSEAFGEPELGEFIPKSSLTL
jgi:hypothetical protein